MLQQKEKAILQPIFDPLWTKKGISFYVKREDLLHDKVSGNKWRKLKYNLEEARILGKTTLLTFGGAYSNHIYATAAAAKAEGFDVIGIIRGERTEPLNPTLLFAEEQGMKLHFISRNEYRNKQLPSFIDGLKSRFGDFYLIPEGGTNNLAIKGCTEIVNEIGVDFNYLCTSVGTGGTISGLIVASGKEKIIGFPSLKGSFLSEEIKNLLKGYSNQVYTNWILEDRFHFGGYAKINSMLIEFIKEFYNSHGIMLDPIYTGKMMFGIFELLKEGYFEENTTITALHTGGLQGWQGMEERMGIKI